jgi:hypothetical protein
MNDEQQICPNRACNSGAWLVERVEGYPDLWAVTHAANEGCWMVAAADPVCPRCGVTLVTLLELEGGLGASDVLEIGPIFDFVRSL